MDESVTADVNYGCPSVAAKLGLREKDISNSDNTNLPLTFRRSDRPLMDVDKKVYVIFIRKQVGNYSGGFTFGPGYALLPW